MNKHIIIRNGTIVTMNDKHVWSLTVPSSFAATRSSILDRLMRSPPAITTGRMLSTRATTLCSQA